MPILDTGAIAFLTIAVGIIGICIGVGLCFFCTHKFKNAKHIILPCFTYAFTVAPLLFLLWNCLAFALHSWVFKGQPMPVTSPTFGVGPTLLAYATIATIFHVTSEVFGSVSKALKAKSKIG